MASTIIKGITKYTIGAGSNGSIQSNSFCIKKDGIVYLTIHITNISNSSTSSTLVATIPSGARPATIVYMPLSYVPRSGATIFAPYSYVNALGEVIIGGGVKTYCEQIMTNATYVAE